MIVILTSYDSLLPTMIQKTIQTILKFYIYLHLENEVIVTTNDKHIFKMKYSYCSKTFCKELFKQTILH
jgi:hypothetical protein